MDLALYRLAVAGAALLVLAPRAAAQDAHYWNQQYGTRSELLGGAVTGSLLDLSATFYNPGGLALLDDPSLLLSAKAFEQQSVSVRDSTGARTGLSESSFGPAPSLFTTLIPLLHDERDQLAFSALSRAQFNVRLSARGSGSGDVLPGAPGLEQYAFEELFDQRMSESWFGVTWSRRITPTTGVGVTPYLAYRGQRTRREASVQALGESGAASSVLVVDDYDYSHYRLLVKAGALWDRTPLTMGIAVTTPSLGLGFLTSGNAYFNRTIIGMDVDGDGNPDHFLVGSSQDKLDVDYRSPWSIALGGSYRFSSTSIHTSAEWFDAVRRYDVLDTTNLPDAPPGVTLTQRLIDERRSLLNVGVGVEHFLRRDFEAYGGFTTDFSAVAPDTDAHHSTSTWDIYHIVGGAAFKVSGLELTGGIGFSFGSAETKPSDALIEIAPETLARAFSNREVRYRRVKYIIGFAFSI